MALDGGAKITLTNRLFALTVLDIVVLWLTWHEFRLRRHGG
jgi:uncharacterized membrane protein